MMQYKSLKERSGLSKFIIKCSKIILIMILAFLLIGVFYLSWQEQQDIKKCMQQGNTFDYCYDLHNW